ncbi:MAG: DMT family transporter [Okeania sp. SIO3I5]|uniref:DMT family transporter n=1 Tax=Okeania sp. SIO3I5 TaxID=2607805 RepID=UPI0013BB1649|nr:DMT family transporter [Okeania sp. SIO3I5]NEQ37847.1 DMT family transporter [Okeania sp. SIO3I5]
MTQELQLKQQSNSNTSSFLGLFSLLFGVFVLSFAAIFTRLSENELGPIATAFNRFTIATIALFSWELIQSSFISKSANNTSPKITLKDWGTIGVLAFFGMINIVSWAWSLTHTSIANSNLLHNTTPIFTTLGAWLFLGYRFDKIFILGMILALTGAIAIGLKDFTIKTDYLIGDSVAFMSAIFYGINYLIREKLRSKFSTQTILQWFCLFSSLLTLPLALIFEKQIFPISWQVWTAVICLGILCQIIGHGLLTEALKTFSSGFVSLFMLLEPLITALFAWLIFAEKLTYLNWISFFIVLGGIYLAKLGQGTQK